MKRIKKYGTFIAFSIFFSSLTAQMTPFAVINDKDGYTNIRYGKDRKVIDKIRSNQVFAVTSIVDEDGWQDWYWIDYPNHSPTEKPFEKFINKTKSGMIHRSRISFLTDLPQWEKSVTDSTLICSHGSSKITVRYGKFIKKDHHYLKDPKNVILKIDGSEPWGIDGILYDNTTEIKYIKLEINNKMICEFPKESIKNMLMPTADIHQFGVAEGSEGTLLLYMSNSDAAGAYDVVWTIKSHRVSNQFIYRNF